MLVGLHRDAPGEICLFYPENGGRLAVGVFIIGIMNTLILSCAKAKKQPQAFQASCPRRIVKRLTIVIEQLFAMH